MDDCTKANNWPNAATWSTVSWLYCEICWAPSAVRKWQSLEKACEWRLRTEMEMGIFRWRSYYQFGSCLTLEKIEKGSKSSNALKMLTKALRIASCSKQCLQSVWVEPAMSPSHTRSQWAASTRVRHVNYHYVQVGSSGRHGAISGQRCKRKRPCSNYCPLCSSSNFKKTKSYPVN